MKQSLRAGLEYRGCILCHAVDQDETDYMIRLQYQIGQEEEARRGLVSSGGFCNFHFHQMTRLTSPKVIALLAKDLLEAERAKVESGFLGSTGEVDCVLCGYAKEQENGYLNEFKTLLLDRSFRRDYESTDGLCRIHLRRVMDLLTDGELRRFLFNTHLMHMTLLRVELETFLSKVGSTLKGMGEEKNAWAIAVEEWVGKRGLS